MRKRSYIAYMYIFHAEHRLHCRIGECIIVYKIYECLVGSLGLTFTLLSSLIIVKLLLLL